MPEPQFRVLVVEDETLVALLLEELLGDLGCALVGPASGVSEALALMAEASFDAAVLDMNLGGQRCDALADALAARGTPFAFATGCGGGLMRPQDADRPMLQKPFTRKELAVLVAELKRLCAAA